MCRIQIYQYFCETINGFVATFIATTANIAYSRFSVSLICCGWYPCICVDSEPFLAAEAAADVDKTPARLVQSVVYAWF